MPICAKYASDVAVAIAGVARSAASATAAAPSPNVIVAAMVAVPAPTAARISVAVATSDNVTAPVVTYPLPVNTMFGGGINGMVDAHADDANKQSSNTIARITAP